MNEQKASSLVPNTLFLLALSLLLLNDFVLKEAFHNWFTGKLSDFCGLYVFAVFWSLLLPKYKLTVHFVVAITFTFWKSPYSQELIDFFSQYIYTISRVVDFSDLLALLVLPFSYSINRNKKVSFNFKTVLIGSIAFFAFCSTSLPMPHITFEQPQYLLFKKNHLVREDLSQLDFLLQHHVKSNSLIIIKVEGLNLEDHPSIYDDYHKTQVLKTLDLSIISEIFDDSIKSEYSQILNIPSGYAFFKDSLLFERDTTISLEIDESRQKDILSFSKGRLNGLFKRITKNGKTIIEGYYRNGIEDSIWCFYNKNEIIQTKKYFKKGETIKVLQFSDGVLISTEEFSTRVEKITSKKFHLAILAILSLMVIVPRVFIYWKEKIEAIEEYPLGIQMLLVFALPLVVIFISIYIKYTILNPSNSNPLLDYIILFILFLVLFSFKRTHHKYEFVYYVLFFALAKVFIEELSFLNDLMVI